MKQEHEFIPDDLKPENMLISKSVLKEIMFVFTSPVFLAHEE